MKHNNQLTILLVEDDAVACAAIGKVLYNIAEMRLIGVTNNAAKAIDITLDCLPDVVILDLELHKGEWDGIRFLIELKKFDIRVPPYILITTNNNSAITHEVARKAGADFILYKQQNNYSAEYVIEFLMSIKEVIQSRALLFGVTEEVRVNESPEQISKRVLKRINAEFDKIGLSSRYVGKKYLVDGIVMTMKDRSVRVNSEVAKKHKKPMSTVWRAMQSAIDRTWKKCNLEEIKIYYNARIDRERGAPTVSEFIFYYAEKMKDDYQ
ncbi:MAG: response regulator [Oscillospiraceae bacterium]|nr:response regulator [Oscillospiraceae bacterium]